MQYVGKVGGYVYNQWNSLNPATLSGAIDVIVIEHPDGTLHTSPWHVRFGKFQIIKPSQKKIDLYVNDVKTNLPMKLGEGGEAHFVFEVDDINHELSNSVLTSPVISPVSSPGSYAASGSDNEPDELDLDEKSKLSDIPSPKSPSQKAKIAMENARKITKKLNIPTKIDMNGDMLIDMDGYKPNSQKNIDNSDELFKKIFLEEIEGDYANGDNAAKPWNQIITKDENGNIRISNISDLEGVDIEDDLISSSTTATSNTTASGTISRTSTIQDDKIYFKTLRLTSEQLQNMNLNYGQNSLKFKSSEGTSQVTANLYLWKANAPIVISDIDGTITKSDALGHVLNLIGRDWTHPGVANLFQEINQNGYHIVYLTARSVGQADSTRQYLEGVVQDGLTLPKGPVILSPDRTFAALRREVVLKKPEIFKMACLSDLRNLFYEKSETNDDEDNDQTPFYAGFGNRITDAISYRSVHIPSHRIFTINPNGEVHMELLELAGYKSSYLHIGELVDHFFPPIKEVNTISSYWNNAQWSEYMQNHDINDYDARSINTHYSPPGSPGPTPGSPRNYVEDYKTDEKFNDVNYWKTSLNFDDLSDIDEEDMTTKNLKGNGKLSHHDHEKKDHSDNPELLQKSKRSRASTIERPLSASFASPLKSFMSFSKRNQKDDDDDEEDEDDEEEYDEEDDDDYTDDEVEEEDDDDYDEEDEDEDEDEDQDDDEEYDDEDFDEEEDLDQELEDKAALTEDTTTAIKNEILASGSTNLIKASEFENLKI
ncbi:ned1 [Candida pseudojiufengensis]|uniref:ned1 n=1 Tax=Candida pseudojiufengensis TaxID=497109 RepID=UPI0022247222|nr:ned1 [Candida pseudojiufengensis]KAI5960678.1 ned1 [Candida pseudojiufengensis]